MNPAAAGPSSSSSSSSSSSPSSYGTLDRQALESYAAEYTGRTQTQRLVFLAKHLPDGAGAAASSSSSSSSKKITAIKRHALELALPTIQSSTMDVALYEECVDMIERMMEAGPEEQQQQEQPMMEDETGNDKSTKGTITGEQAEQEDEEDGGDAVTLLDEQWLSETAIKAKRELEKLEVEMKTYSTNMIKESIRVSVDGPFSLSVYRVELTSATWFLAQLTHHSLAAALIQTGDLQGAVKNYVKARDYNSTAAHELDASMGIVQVTLLTRQYHQTLPAIVKAEYAIQRMAAKGAPVPVGSGAARANNQEDLGEGLVASVLGGGSLRTVETGAESRERQRRARELDELGQRMTFRLRAAKGVALMGSGQYEAAAREFIGLEGSLGEWEGKVKPAAKEVPCGFVCSHGLPCCLGPLIL